LRRQIELVQPKVILVVGRIAAQSLLQVTTPVGKLRGQVHEFEGLPLVVTYHPAYLLRSPTQKAKSWQDLLLAQNVLKGAAG
jgi:DNA polymerase